MILSRSATYKSLRCPPRPLEALLLVPYTASSAARRPRNLPLARRVASGIGLHVTFVQHSTLRSMNQLFVARMVAVVLTATVISTAVNKYIVEPRVSKPKDK